MNFYRENPVMVHTCGREECDGIETLRVDPYNADVWGVYDLVWLCDGAAMNSADEI